MPESREVTYRRRANGTMEVVSDITTQVSAADRELEEIEDRIRSLLRTRRTRPWTAVERDKGLRLLMRMAVGE